MNDADIQKILYLIAEISAELEKNECENRRAIRLLGELHELILSL